MSVAAWELFGLLCRPCYPNSPHIWVCVLNLQRKAAFDACAESCRSRRLCAVLPSQSLMRRNVTCPPDVGVNAFNSPSATEQGKCSIDRYIRAFLYASIVIYCFVHLVIFIC